MKVLTIINHTGSPHLTKVLDLDGNDVTANLAIKEIVWRHRAGESPTVELICDAVAVEVVGEC